MYQIFVTNQPVTSSGTVLIKAISHIGELWTCIYIHICIHTYWLVFCDISQIGKNSTVLNKTSYCIIQYTVQDYQYL